MGGPLGPRLAGQAEVYLADQLTAFKGGELQDPTQAMNGIADSLSEGEIKATARYVAGLTPVSNPEAE
jgi:cytochrome c553